MIKFHVLLQKSSSRKIKVCNFMKKGYLNDCVKFDKDVNEHLGMVYFYAFTPNKINEGSVHPLDYSFELTVMKKRLSETL